MLSIRSYVRSTDCNCESRSQNVICRIDVSVVKSPTTRTFPLTYIKRQFINYVTAMSASFTRWKPSVNFYQFTTVPLAFVFELSNQFTPSCIVNATGKGTVLNHIPYSQVLNRYYLVFAYQLSRQFVQKINSCIFNLSLNLSYGESSFLSIFRTFYSPRKSLLCGSKFSILVVEMLGVSNFFPMRGSHQASQPCVQPNVFGSWWQWLNRWVVNQKRDEPTTLRVKLDRDSGRVAQGGEISTPNYVERLLTFSEPQLSIKPLKGRTGKFSIPTIALLFKVGIFGSFCPKVFKGFAQMAQRLLKRNATDFVQKSQFCFFLPIGQHRRGLIVYNPLLSLIPSLGSLSKSFVVNQPNTTHCLTQEQFLFWRWVKPIFVGALCHLQHSIQQFSHCAMFNLKTLSGGGVSSHGRSCACIVGLHAEIR
jgi:hypothetical protein